MLSEKEQSGYQALRTFLGHVLIRAKEVTILYPGSSDRLEHITELVSIVCAPADKLKVIMVDPKMDEALLRKKCNEHPDIDVHAFEMIFSSKHIPESLTIYFERAFDIFRDQALFEQVVEALVLNGLFVSDAKIAHPKLQALQLPSDVKQIGFYPEFGIYRKI